MWPGKAEDKEYWGVTYTDFLKIWQEIGYPEAEKMASGNEIYDQNRMQYLSCFLFLKVSFLRKMTGAIMEVKVDGEFGFLGLDMLSKLKLSIYRCFGSKTLTIYK